MVDNFIVIVSKMRKETDVPKSKYRHTMNEFSMDYLTFENVHDIVVDIENLWIELEQFEYEFTENAPYYLNYYFSGLVVHLSTWFLFKQTSQQTQELINLILNNLYRKGNKFGGRKPKSQEFKVFGKNTETNIPTNRALETMITTQNKFQLIQKYNLEADD